MPLRHQQPDHAAKKIVDRVGKQIVLGIPLGIGKPIGFVNALYRLAQEDPSIQLTIFTGLTLSRPLYRNELEKRFVEPILDRVLKDYEDPLYEKARLLQQVPGNIRIIEFFLSPAKYIGNSYVQQNYISTTYTNATKDLLAHSMNVIAQQVSSSNTHANKYSLSCNTDLFHQSAANLYEQKRHGKEIALIAEVNANLPFMYGEDAVVNADTFTDIIDTGHYRAIFAIPREELSVQDHLIGIYTSTLIKDNGSLQVGIGKLSNAVANALILRHQHNSLYLDLLEQLSIQRKFGDSITACGQLTPFDQGLYAPTEMLSDEYIQLYQAGILKRQVFPHAGIQNLLNLQKITEKVTPLTLQHFLENNLIHSFLTNDDFLFLKEFGIIKDELQYRDGQLIFPNGETTSADLAIPEIREKICNGYLGAKLKKGKIIHAGFFLGSSDFYDALRKMSIDELNQIEMTSVFKTNLLSSDPELFTLQRQQARFVNSAIMIALSGSIISDGLENLQELSGVGGQFEFVYMTQQLPNARSIINCRSTRKHGRHLISNIVWEHSNFTIPRYLRDIVITEYGIADCRNKTDSEIIKSLLNITDSHFQEKLLKQAKKYGKLPTEYEIPYMFQKNTAESIKPIIHRLQLKGYCQPYPFGSDLTDEEVRIRRVLSFLKNQSRVQLTWLALRALFFYRKDDAFRSSLLRMKLLQPKSLKEYIYKKIFKFLLNDR